MLEALMPKLFSVPSTSTVSPPKRSLHCKVSPFASRTTVPEPMLTCTLPCDRARVIEAGHCNAATLPSNVPGVGAAFGPGFDLHPSGLRFAVSPASPQTNATAQRPSTLVLVFNLFDELRRQARR